MDMDQKNLYLLSKHNLDVLEKSTEAVSKLYGRIKLLEHQIVSLDRNLDEHESREGENIKIIKDELRRIVDEIKKLNSLLDASPYKDLEKLIRFVMEKLNGLLKWANMVKMGDVTVSMNQVQVIHDYIVNIGKTNIEYKKLKYGFWTAFIVAICGIVGTIASNLTQ